MSCSIAVSSSSLGSSRMRGRNRRRGRAVLAEVAAAVLHDPPREGRPPAAVEPMVVPALVGEVGPVHADRVGAAAVGARAAGADVAEDRRHRRQRRVGEPGGEVVEARDAVERVDLLRHLHFGHAVADLGAQRPVGGEDRAVHRDAGLAVLVELGGERGDGRVVALVLEDDVHHHRLRLVGADRPRMRAWKPYRGGHGSSKAVRSASRSSTTDVCARPSRAHGPSCAFG